MFRSVGLSALTVTSLALVVAVPTSAAAQEQCSSYSISCGDESAQACCDLNSCRYRTSGGREFPCNGHDCQSAAQELVNYCQGLSSGDYYGDDDDDDEGLDIPDFGCAATAAAPLGPVVVIGLLRRRRRRS